MGLKAKMNQDGKEATASQGTGKTSDTITKRRLKLYGHLRRMDNNMLTKTTLNLPLSLNSWLLEMNKDLQEIGINGETMKTERNSEPQ